MNLYKGLIKRKMRIIDMKFKAYAVSNEVDLNDLALQCSIPKKYTWEEPLILTNIILEKLLHKSFSEDQKVYVFAFGSVVTINFSLDEDNQVVQYLKSYVKEINLKEWQRFSDEYEIITDPTVEQFSFTDEVLKVKQFEPAYLEIAATVIAKSVALEKVEDYVKKIMDKVENMVVRLEKGKFRLSDKKLAKTIAQVLRHEYNTIAYIMILDKPDITWDMQVNSDLYDQMSVFFELNDRYEIMKSKTEILNNIIDGFATISHSMRGVFIEWLIVILIIAEVVLMLLDLIQ